MSSDAVCRLCEANPVKNGAFRTRPYQPDPFNASVNRFAKHTSSPMKREPDGWQARPALRPKGEAWWSVLRLAAIPWRRDLLLLPD